MKYLKEKGFTLVELMIVIVIVGILAAVAIPKFSVAADKARASEFPTILTGVYTNEEAYKAENGTYSGANDWAGINMTQPTSRWFGYTFTTTGGSTFQAQASVVNKFGTLNNETAWINDSNSKSCAAELLKYAPQWRNN
jgi:type IV pilus assembly protein PilE